MSSTNDGGSTNGMLETSENKMSKQKAASLALKATYEFESFARAFTKDAEVLKLLL